MKTLESPRDAPLSSWGHPSVYVSSTYEDLKEERAHVLKAVAALEASAIAMENYGALDQSALEKCVADVERSNVYVGLVGWRYGYVPKGSELSITEHEFLAAKRAGIPRLIYMTGDATRPAECRDGDPILNYRRMVSETLMRREFTSKADLGIYVTTDLSRELFLLGARFDQDRILLPHLCDRELQTQAIRMEVAQPRAGGPPICVVQGGENQRPHRFLECVRKVHLPRYTGSKKIAKEYSLNWPAANRVDMSRHLRLELADKLGLDIRTSPDELERRVRAKITEQDCPVLLSFRPPSSKLDAAEFERLRAIFEYFRAWPQPENAARKPDLLVIYLEYPAPKSGLLARLGLDSSTRKGEARRAALAELNTSDGVCVLPELADIRASDVRALTQNEEFMRLELGHDLDGDIDRIFSGEETLSMAELAPQLIKLLINEVSRLRS